MKNHIETPLFPIMIESYQKIIFSKINIAPIIDAQKIGCCHRDKSPSDGISVHPRTKPTNSDSGFGFVR